MGCRILCKRGFVNEIVSTITLFVGKRLRQLGRFFCSTNPAGSGMIPYPMINRQKHDTPIFLEYVSNACDRWFVEDTNNACLRGSGLIINANVKMDEINYNVYVGGVVWDTSNACVMWVQATSNASVSGGLSNACARRGRLTNNTCVGGLDLPIIHASEMVGSPLTPTCMSEAAGSPVTSVS